MRVPSLVLLIACETPDDKGSPTRTVVTDTLTDTTTPITGTDETGIDETGHTGDPGHSAVVPPPECATTPPAAVAQPFDPACLASSTIGLLDPVVEWRWDTNPTFPGATDVMTTPVAVNLTDDDGDGDVDDDDAPDLVFGAFIDRYEFPRFGPMVALSGVDGSQLWAFESVGGVPVGPIAGIAAGDLDGDGVIEIVAVNYQDQVYAFHAPVGGAEAELVWVTDIPIPDTKGQPAIADLEGDGRAEVVIGANVLEADGAIRWQTVVPDPVRMMSFPVDLDGDGLMEIVAGNTVYEHDGSVRFSDPGLDGYPAVANLDADPAPEFVRAINGLVQANDDDFSVLWSWVPPDLGGGPPVVADFDGDGEVEIGIGFKYTYRVFERDGTMMWEMPITDTSSGSIGSTAFDFDGDGAAEVVVADEQTLWVFDGETGAVELAWDAHGSGTSREYPLVVDLDHDGAGELVLASNDYWVPGTSGITVLGDAGSGWPAAPAIWNQHAFHVDNVGPMGEIPTSEVPSWTTHNTFRSAANEAPTGRARPDWRIGVDDPCLDECDRDRVITFVPVENVGAVDGGPVTVQVDSASGSWSFDAGVVPAGGQVWVGPLTLTSADYTSGVTLTLVPAGEQCDTANDVVTWSTWPCP